jgi:hypothetical protein
MCIKIKHKGEKKRNRRSEEKSKVKEKWKKDKGKKKNAKECHNPSFGLTTKARAYGGAGQQWSPKVTFHVFGSIGECEGMNPHTPKWVPTLGVGVPMDSWIYKGRLQGSKFIRLKSYLYH